MFSKLFGIKKSSTNESQQVGLVFTQTQKNEFAQFCKQYRSFIKGSLFDQMLDYTLGLRPTFEISAVELQKLNEVRKQRIEEEELLYSTVNLNNEGIKLEKSGQIDAAIECYEKNIKDGYTATHSYERLMVIYRKRKMYRDELRVIDRALEVFGLENERRFNSSVSDPENTKYIDQIQLGMEQNIGIKNDKGWFIFSPYPIIKWIERRGKVLALIERNRH